jgi:hypothetical protein
MAVQLIIPIGKRPEGAYAIFIPKETIMTKRKVLALAVILMMALSAANIHAQEVGDNQNSASAEPDAYAINLGLGVVGDFEWHFGERWYAYGRVAFALNFGAFEFLLMPGLGMGFSF